MKKRLIYLSVFIVFIIILKIFLLEIYTVSHTSMNNTLKQGDKVLILKSLYNIKRHDILVFNYNDEVYIKRCIGLPSEKIKIKAGCVYVNGSAIKEVPTIIKNTEEEFDSFSISQIHNRFEQNWNLLNFGIYIIPQKEMKIECTNSNKSIYGNLINWNQYNIINTEKKYCTFNENCFFLIGDNRPQSNDSRYFGAIRESDIIGKVIFKF